MTVSKTAFVDTSKNFLPVIIDNVETNAGIKKDIFLEVHTRHSRIKYCSSSSVISVQTVRLRLLCVRSPFHLWCNQSIKITHQEHEQMFRIAKRDMKNIVQRAFLS